MSNNNFINKMKGFEISKKRNLWLIISSSIIAFAIIMMIIFSALGMGFMNLGIDFTGGTLMRVTIGDDLLNDSNFNDASKVITNILDENKLAYNVPQKEGAGETLTIAIRYRNEIDGKSADESKMSEVREKVEGDIKIKVNEFFDGKIVSSSFVSSESVGATQGTSNWLNALYCILIAAVLILIYVGFRFKFSTGFAAIIALLHDILIMFAFVVIFRVQINAPFIAALITIIGYSINDTIVIFDKIRESMKKIVGQSSINYYQIADDSIRKTFVRSINTSVTTILVTVVLCILGVPAIREFTLPIIIGLIAGTYSSICIAPPIWATFQTMYARRKKSDGAKQANKNKKSAKVSE